MARKKKTPLTKNQLEILYQCWKEGANTKERLALIEERMPKVSTLTALKIMRKMAKTDPKWLKWTTRQRNLKEKEQKKNGRKRNRKRENVSKNARHVSNAEKNVSSNKIEKVNVIIYLNI